MTNNQLNRERLEKIKSWRETYGAGSNVMLPAEEAEELARIALAAMDSKPVILYRQVNPVNGMKTYWAELDPEEFRHLKQHTDENAEFMTLYRHTQPAPVVEREPIAWLNDAYLARGVVDGEVGSEDAGPGYIPVYREAGPQPAPVVPEEKPIPNTLSMYAVDAVAAIAEVKGWNACRAAMLAAAPQSPGSEPATVPGKWIPVSERMPDCWCLTCRPVVLNDMRFVVCPDCGNKRCPRANDHRNACTGSNEPGQEGGAYPDTPQEVKP